MKAASSDHLLSIFRLVKEMQKKYKLKVVELHENKNVCQQKPLICFDKTRKTVSTLKNIIIRPTLCNGEKLRQRNSSTQCGILEVSLAQSISA